MPFAKYANNPTPVCIREKNTHFTSLSSTQSKTPTEDTGKEIFKLIWGWLFYGSVLRVFMLTLMSFWIFVTKTAWSRSGNLYCLFPFLLSDGAHDGDDVSGRAGGVRSQCPQDLWRLRGQGHRLPLQCHDLWGLQRVLQVSFILQLMFLHVVCFAFWCMFLLSVGCFWVQAMWIHPAGYFSLWFGGLFAPLIMLFAHFCQKDH